MYEYTSLEALRKQDYFALSPMTKDRRGYHTTKRILDFTAATILLILLMPLLLFIGLLIKLDSPGSIFFIQERVGAKRSTQNGYSYWKRHNFSCYKFRTMYENASSALHEEHIRAFVSGQLNIEENGGAKIVSDPRITRVGQWLRKTSLDELPQLINIIKGEMSIVGPRPVPVYEVEEYDSWHYERLAALPGITGLWQVRGRGRVSFDEMVDLDIEYVRHESFWLDCKILLLTIPAVIFGHGAE